MTSNPVVAVLPTFGWYLIFKRLVDDEPLTAWPVEYATVHADGSRKLWGEGGRGTVQELRPTHALALVRDTIDAERVQWNATEWAEVSEESSASWRPLPPA